MSDTTNYLPENDAMPNPDNGDGTRGYILGLPVAVTIRDDGTVHLSVDAAEVTSAIADEYGGYPSIDAIQRADRDRFDAAFEAGTITANTMQQDWPA